MKSQSYRVRKSQREQISEAIDQVIMGIYAKHVDGELSRDEATVVVHMIENQRGYWLSTTYVYPARAAAMRGES